MKICSFIILIFFSFKTFSQVKRAVKENCDFLKNLHFKNGVDTIIIKARYHAIFSQEMGLILNDLDKKKLTKAKILKSAIDFEVLNCSKNLMAPYHFENKAAMDFIEKQADGTIIYLTCVVFEDYYNYGQPFFIIDKLDMKNPE